MTDNIQNGEGVELLPCPFCGGQANWVEDSGALDTPFGLVVDHADTCFHTGRMMANWETIITAWNTRHSLAREPATADVERGTLEARDTAQSAVEAWAEVFEGLEAHLQDRIAMQDEGSPATYLSIIRGSVANVLRASVQIRAARWADYNRQSWRIAELEAQIAALSRAAPSSERTDEQEAAKPRCGCKPEIARRVIIDHGTCGMGGCPYGGDF